MVRIRLQRHGRKKRPFYYLVVADQKAKRDGRFIEKIGTFDPISQPSKINVNIDRSIYWLGVGAQPTDTARMLLSKSGALMKNHLNGGVKKGAFSQEEADKKFEDFMKSKLENDLKKLDNEKKKKEEIIKKKKEEELKNKEEEEKAKKAEAEKVEVEKDEEEKSEVVKNEEPKA